MAGSQVYMEVPAVREMGKKFGQISEILATVNKVLEMLSNVLKTTAFIGMVGGFAVAQMIDRIRPQIEEMSEKTEEIGKDLGASADAYERGDAIGATKFY